MIHYHVHYLVNFEVYEPFLQWLKEDSIPVMLKQSGFIGAELLLNKGGALVSSGKDVKVIFRVENEAALKAYLANAMDLRQKGVDKFPGQFSAQREVWMETDTF